MLTLELQIKSSYNDVCTNFLVSAPFSNVTFTLWVLRSLVSILVPREVSGELSAS